MLGAFFWGYSGYSYSGLGITEYAEFQFRKERSLCFKSGNEGLLGGGGGYSYPCKSGGIYPLSLKVPRLLSLKVLLSQLSLIPKTPNRASEMESEVT